MTIGDKIKYCRNHCGISQVQLSKIGNIDLSSIKRYETNKVAPTYPQIKKIANALGISTLAFTNAYFEGLQQLETYGDLMGIFIILRKNHLIQIDGDRDDDGHILPTTAVFNLNPIIGVLFSAVGSEDTFLKDMAFRLADKNAFPQQLFADLLKWEYVYTKYESLVSKYKDSGDENIAAALKEDDEVLGKIELELQYNNRMLKQTDGHITVKVNPDYGNEDALMKERDKAIKKELKLQKSKSKNSRKKNDEKNKP